MGLVIAVFAVLLTAVLLSYVVEANRRPPPVPDKLYWAPNIPILEIVVNGDRLRYIQAGKEGPVVVLLHTLRTQLDLFERVVPELSRDFRVYAVDYPGHGFSAIPQVDYTPRMFAESVGGFLDALNIKGAIIVGESIGGALGLLLAAEQHPGVAGVVAINSYDYGQGRGITRGSLLAKVIFTLSRVPVVGGTVWRFRFPGIFRLIINSSVHDESSLTPALVNQMHEAGNRPYHYRAFMSLIEHFPEWEELRSHYPQIEVPVLLVYGRYDWPRPEERQANCDLIAGGHMETVDAAGHLLSLDTPESTIRLVREFANTHNIG